ncbi:hypothetical protein [Tardiphaga sp. 813_E8_N1_3]|uniref:hypothetical protein n=1 Tax=Tardiphaga sp. 813_E8_N1_3 TaxID=3240760 RepID=UPI003F242BF3
MSNRVSFNIGATNERREVFFFLENLKTGDLKLFFRRTKFHNPYAKTDDRVGKLVDEQRYSIWTSPDSPHGINTIHHTYRVGNDQEESFSFTKVVKEKTGFIPLFARRCPNLAKDHYKAKLTPKTVSVDLGSYDPAAFIFLYSVFLGPAERVFRLYMEKDVNFAQHHFSKFSIIVLWNFLSLPSTDDGYKSHYIRPHPTDIQKQPDLLRHADLPLQESDCVLEHLRKAAYFRHQFLCWIEDQHVRRTSSTFGQLFQFGTRNSPEYRKHVQLDALSILAPPLLYPCDPSTFTLDDERIVESYGLRGIP